MESIRLWFLRNADVSYDQSGNSRSTVRGLPAVLNSKNHPEPGYFDSIAEGFIYYNPFRCFLFVSDD